MKMPIVHTVHRGPLLILLWIAASLAITAHGTEYFVAFDGNDAADGTTESTAFATVQRGVNALQAGDTLTILPGEYVGSVFRDGIGGPDADTVIRAAIPGTVILRGDVPAPEFKPLDGFRFVYVADFKADEAVRGINEWDTLTILPNAVDYQSLEFVPGRFFYDAEAGKLYMSTPDLTPPSQRTYTVSVNKSHGIYLRNAERVIIDGLGVTGFSTDRLLPQRDGTYGAVWSIFLRDAKNSVVRNCRSWMNGQGIGLASIAEGTGDNLITHCVAWSNNSDYGNGDRGGFTIHGDRNGRRDSIRHCTSFLNQHGVNIYLTNNLQELNDETRNRLMHNVAWGNSVLDFKIKTGYTNSHTVEYCAGPGNWVGVGNRASHCLIGSEGSSYSDDNIVLANHKDLDWDLQFADPLNHDYRLQSDSVLRGTGPDSSDPGPYPYTGNVYFVAPTGNDRSAGQSVKTAWRTLNHALRSIRAGDTLYLEPGSYWVNDSFAFDGSADKPIVIRSRGAGEAEINGNFSMTGGFVEFERIQFLNTVQLFDASSVQFKSCRFLARGTQVMQMANSTGVSIVHCQFTGFGESAIELHSSQDLFVQGTVFNNVSAPAYRLTDDSSILYRDYNAYANAENVLYQNGTIHGVGATRPGNDYYSYAIPSNQAPRATTSAHGWKSGPWRPEMPEPSQPSVTRPVVYAAAPSSVNLEWWSSVPMEYTLTWGPVDAPGKQNTESVMAYSFASHSLIGLKPDTEYFVRLDSDKPFTVWGETRDSEATSLEFTFRTPASYARDAATFYVSPGGSDDADGLTPATAWRSLNTATGRLQPGDTLLLLDGKYVETVWLRVSGEEEKPITIASAPGAKVVLSGMDRTLGEAFILPTKSHVRIDGLYFTGFSTDAGALPWRGRIKRNAVINVYGGKDVHISRCFLSGRGQGTSSGLVQAMYTSDLLVENSVVVSNMSGAIAVTASPDTTIRNCVFLHPFISVFTEIMNEPDQLFTVENSIITDNLVIKRHAPLYGIGMAKSLRENNNCYFFRPPENEKTLFRFYGAKEYDRAAEVYGGVASGFPNRMFEEATTMTLAEYKERLNPKSTSIIANPEFAGGIGVSATNSKGGPVFIPDSLSTNPDLDFPDLFATNPIVTERGIGLNPAAFAGFHFTNN